MTQNDQQLAKIHKNLSSLIKAKANAMPVAFNQTRFIQNAMSVLADTQGLGQIEPHSIARTILKGAFLNLDFFLGECFAIPYNKNIAPKGSPAKYVKELQFQTCYKGEIKLVKKYSLRKITEVYAKLVREGDTFIESMVDGSQSISFAPIPLNKKPITGVFAVCLYADGGLLVESMTTDEVNSIRDKFSKVPTGKAWKESYGEMAKKTVLRRLCKGIQIEFDNAEADEAFEAGADAEFTEFEDVTTAEPIQMPSETQAETSSNGKEGDQLSKMLELLHGEKAGEWLELSTSFTDKNTEKLVTGKREVAKLTEKQRPFVFRALKKELQGKADLMAVELYPDKETREKALAGMSEGVVDIEEMATAAQVQTYEILLNLKLDKEAKATEAK